MSTESFTTNKKERMQEGVSLAQGEKKHLAGQQLTPRYEVVQQLSLIFPDLRAANIIQALIS